MKFSRVAATCALAQGALSWPGMTATFQNVLKRAERAAAANADCKESVELIGDLEWLQDHELSNIGALVRNIILGYESGETDQIRNAPPLHSYECQQDTCCVWWYIADEMERLFRGPSGRCTNPARAAIRLGFHDAAGWSKFTGQSGGADGSIVLAPEESQRLLNGGLQEIIEQMKIWHSKWESYGVGMADLIQMAATVATVVCPLGPRIRSFVGRPDNSNPCQDGLLPLVDADADTLIELFRAKTIQPYGLAALLGAHSTSQQRFVDPSRFGDPQDSTPGVWDTLFYSETLSGRAPPRVFTLRSDIVLSEDPRIYPEFRAFAGPGGQQHWNNDYAREYVRLSLLGVYNINNLTDCSWVLPPAIRPRYDNDGYPTDQWAINAWANTTINIPEIAEEVMAGNPITNLIGLLAPGANQEKRIFCWDATPTIKAGCI
ncbi:ligninase h2 precursor [Podospora aff. communis PSN243]|uniref:Peroxidase n=1 Tax=Podospora aff. communis PSN243 TaxID=3040156 RepID=A0AAV9H3J1_9PEZI|nr:ligninase h2 precursor [Podospora aff. communis PSN243]